MSKRKGSSYDDYRLEYPLSVRLNDEQKTALQLPLEELPSHVKCLVPILDKIRKADNDTFRAGYSPPRAGLLVFSSVRLQISPHILL